MLSLQWNALRPGDHVAVHDDSERSSPLRDGVVVLVESGRRGSDIAVRVTEPDGATHVRRPPRLTVHLDPLGHDETCWRCRMDADGRIVGELEQARHG